MKDNCMHLSALTLGVCYYPEHWDPSLWEEDLQRMKKAGIQVIRIAEFAWNKFEPQEGLFTFDFFDRYLEVVAQTDMKVIFCTPTATPPAWASTHYPEILNQTKEGVVYRHGLRRHYNYNSPKYLQLTRDIVEQLARHYGGHPSIIGWQIDNEINCEVNEFYAKADNDAFRVFLQKKYPSIEALNQAWGTVFWNQDYNSWDQVCLPQPTVQAEANPHRQLDYLRFVSDSACRYVGLQSEILRRHIPQQVFITTNGLFGNVDNHRQTRENLDFMTFDSYPNFAFLLGTDPKNSQDLNDRKWSRHLSETRSISPVFGIMEQQSGPGGWHGRMAGPAPKPGQATLWTMQSVAHGADFVSYFRWRTCTVGTEMYWHGILDYDNQDNRRLAEITQVGENFQKLAPLAGSRYQAAFALVKEYDNVWDAQDDTWHGLLDKESQQGWFTAAQCTHTPMDFLYITQETTAEDLAAYPLLVYPHACIIAQRTADLLTAYVEGGGKLIVGSRTGYKNGLGHGVMQVRPGLLSPLFGVEVRDGSFVGPADEGVQAQWGETLLDCPVYNDVLSPVGQAQVLARFTGNYFAGAPALVKSQRGKGEAYYFGGAFSAQTAAVFLEKLGLAEPYRQLVTLPEGCEIALRKKEDQQYLFLLNYQWEDVEIQLHREMENLITGARESGPQRLEKFGTRVYKL